MLAESRESNLRDIDGLVEAKRAINTGPRAELEALRSAVALPWSAIAMLSGCSLSLGQALRSRDRRMTNTEVARVARFRPKRTRSGPNPGADPSTCTGG